jgi:hypothetical protein
MWAIVYTVNYTLPMLTQYWHWLGLVIIYIKGIRCEVIKAVCISMERKCLPKIEDDSGEPGLYSSPKPVIKNKNNLEI